MQTAADNGCRSASSLACKTCSSCPGAHEYKATWYSGLLWVQPPRLLAHTPAKRARKVRYFNPTFCCKLASMHGDTACVDQFDPIRTFRGLTIRVELGRLLLFAQTPRCFTLWLRARYSVLKLIEERQERDRVVSPASPQVKVGATSCRGPMCFVWGGPVDYSLLLCCGMYTRCHLRLG